MVFDKCPGSAFDRDFASLTPSWELPQFTWQGPAIGLLDLDAFFASVEQLDHPQWGGKAGHCGRRFPQAWRGVHRQL